MEQLIKDYRTALQSESFEPKLVDFLVSLFVDLVTKCETLNGFTKTSIDIKVY